MSRHLHRMLAWAAVALAFTAVVPAPAQAADQPSTSGADLVSIRLEGGKLSLGFRDYQQARAGEKGRNPADLRLGGEPGTAGLVPDGGSFAFLGRAGTPVWAMSSPGSEPVIDTTSVPRGQAGSLRLSLTCVQGPGDFVAYTVSSVGEPTLQLSSAAKGPSHLDLTPGVRQASIWAFTAPGEYRVMLRAQVTGAGAAQAEYRVTVPAAPFANPDLEPLKVDKAVATASASPNATRRVAAAATGNRVVIADGHVDMGPQLTGNGWTIRIKDDSTSPPTWRELSDVVLHAVDRAKISVPAGADYAFLGSAGSTVWLLPQAQQSGILWPGWNTQDPSVVNGTRGATTWKVDNVTGPGAFKLFLTGSFGKPQVLFDTAKPMPQTIPIPANTHAHGNWAFTAKGLYRLQITMTGTRTSGATLTDTRTLTIAVGDDTDPGAGFTPGPGGNLPRTGQAWLLPAASAGAGLIAVGAVILLVTRRRRSTAAEPGA